MEWKSDDKKKTRPSRVNAPASSNAVQSSGRTGPCVCDDHNCYLTHCPCQLILGVILFEKKNNISFPKDAPKMFAQMIIPQMMIIDSLSSRLGRCSSCRNFFQRIVKHDSHKKKFVQEDFERKNWNQGKKNPK